MRWRQTEIRDIMLNPANIGIKVSPEDIFLLNVRGYYLLLGTKFSQEALTKEKFKELYLKFLDLARENGFTVENHNPNFSDSWLDNQLERVKEKRKFANAINDMLEKNK
ncbi:MAG: hypothetical protein JM58_15270 [Peptococcaceae bacterium BICA1-8]|nr:MAG: hypothetical protein JM58_15270 [Peptococcaceae bacterium BICA1-8]